MNSSWAMGDKPTQSGSKRTVLTLLGLLLLIGVGGYQIAKSQQSPSEEILPVRRSEPQSVTALGWLEPEGEIIHVAAPPSREGDRVERLLVNVGDSVEAGETIAILDRYDLRQAAVDLAQRDIDIAMAQLAQIEAGAKPGDIEAQRARFNRNQAELNGQLASQRAAIANLDAQLNGDRRAQEAQLRRLEAEVSTAEKDCQRYQDLYQQGAVSEQQRDFRCLDATRAVREVEEAQAQYQRIISTGQAQIQEAEANLARTQSTLDSQIREAEASLEAIAQIRPTDIRLAQSQLQAAIAKLNQAEADLALAVIKAPQAGRILDIHTHPGEVVAPDGIVSLGQTNSMTVLAEVYESDVGQIEVGLPARISSNALPQDLQGTVQQVGLQVLRQSELDLDPAANVDARIVEVRINLDDESSQIATDFTNLHVTVRIDLANTN
jgi:HlyD family secretion protein